MPVAAGQPEEELFAEIDRVAFEISSELLRMPVLKELLDSSYEMGGG